MLFRWKILLQISFIILGVCTAKKQQDLVQKVVTGSSDTINASVVQGQKGLKAFIGSPFKPLEITGTQLENAAVEGINIFSQIFQSLAESAKKLASTFQQKQEKLMGCVKSQQFDPAKAIVLDISTCLTSKIDKVNNIILTSLMEVNSTYNMMKSAASLPQCESAKCLAGYTSDAGATIGNMCVGLAKIAKGLIVDLSLTPGTLPVCFATKPEISAAKVFGKLGTSIMKCFKG